MASQPAVFARQSASLSELGLASDPALFGLGRDFSILPAFAQPAQAAGTGISTADLLGLANAIPLAQDGQIISAAHHNTMRAILVALINRVGGAAAQSSLLVTSTVSPALFADPSDQPWAQRIGYVEKPAPAAGNFGGASGWAPIELPDQTTIQSMTILGSRTGAVGTIEFELIRQPLSSTAGTTLIQVKGDATTDPFNHAVTFDPGLLQIGASSEAVHVDHSKYKYMIHAHTENSTRDSIIQIFAFQVACTVG